MKKYKTLLPIIMACCLLLTSCNQGGGENETETSVPEATPPQTTVPIQTTVPEEITPPPFTMSKEEVEESAKSLPVQSFVAPDGKKLKAEEAVSITEDEGNKTYTLTYAKGYMGYAQPIYSDTDMDKSLYDFESGKFNQESPVNDDTEVKGQEYQNFKKGQVLPNGLTVSEAYSVVSLWEEEGKSEYKITDTAVTFSGELTLEGVLYCRRKENEGVESYNEILFYPDLNNSDNVPLPCCNEDYFVLTLKDARSDFALVTSAFPIKLGSVGNIDMDLTDYFSEADCVKARVKISNIIVRNHLDLPVCFGVLREAEKIK